MRRRLSQRGFTVVELVLALALFSGVLLIVSVGFLNIFHMYETGLATRSTQDNGRTAMEEIARVARGMSTAELDSAGGVCLYQTTRSDSVAYKLAISGQALWLAQYNPSVAGNYTGSVNCAHVNLAAPGVVHTQLTAADVAAQHVSTTMTTPPAGSPGKFQTVTVNVVLVAKNGAPGNGVVGSSGGPYSCAVPAQSYFCAVVPLSTTLTLRGTP